MNTIDGYVLAPIFEELAYMLADVTIPNAKKIMPSIVIQRSHLYCKEQYLYVLHAKDMNNYRWFFFHDMVEDESWRIFKLGETGHWVEGIITFDLDDQPKSEPMSIQELAQLLSEEVKERIITQMLK